MSPDTVEHSTNACQPEVFFMKHREPSDTGTEVEVRGCGEVASSVLMTDLEGKEDLCGDVENLKTFQKDKNIVKIFNIALNKTKCRLHGQARKIRRVRKAVLQIKQNVQFLKKEEMLTDEGQSVLFTALINILDHINYKKVMQRVI